MDQKTVINVFGYYELFLYGLLESDSSFRKKIFNWIIRCLMMLNYLVWTYVFIVNFFLENFKPENIHMIPLYLSILYIFWLNCIFLCGILMWKREVDINQLMIEIYDHSDSKTKRSLKRV